MNTCALCSPGMFKDASTCFVSFCNADARIRRKFCGERECVQEAPVVAATEDVAKELCNDPSGCTHLTQSQACKRHYDQLTDLEKKTLTFDPVMCKCALCPLGRFTGTDGQPACTPCPPGRAGAYRGASSNATCTPCKPGRFVTKAGSAECLSCAAGTYSHRPAAASCSVCGAGEYQDEAAQADCKPCSRNTFNGDSLKEDATKHDNADDCIPCPDNQLALKNGSANCELCAAGRYTINGSLITRHCADCPAGWTVDASGSTQCSQCRKGTYQSETGKSTCFDCSPGTLQTRLGRHDCDDCPAGYYVNVPGATTCRLCPSGRQSTGNGSTSCETCPAGNFGPGCGRCPAGTYRGNEDANLTLCLSCPAGYFSKPREDATTGAAFCSACDPGFATNLTRQSVCTRCPTGRVQNEKRSKVCGLCPDNSGFIPNDKQTDCVRPGWTVAYDCRQNVEYLDDSAGGDDVTSKQQWTCLDCPAGALCDFPASSQTLVTKPGFWRVPDNWHEVPSNATFVRCPRSWDCEGEADSGDPRGCVNGTTGTLCDMCVPGYDRMGGVCSKCGPAEIPLRSFLLVLFMILALGALFCAVRKLKQLHRKYGHAWRDIILAIKIFVSFQQVNATLPAIMANYPWPTGYLDFLNKMSFVQIDVIGMLGIQCVVKTNHRTDMLVALAVPVLIVVGGRLMYAHSLGRAKRTWLTNSVDTLDEQQTRALLEDLFYLVDDDMTGTLDVAEFKHLLEYTRRPRRRRLSLGGVLRRRVTVSRKATLAVMASLSASPGRAKELIRRDEDGAPRRRASMGLSRGRTVREARVRDANRYEHLFVTKDAFLEAATAGKIPDLDLEHVRRRIQSTKLRASFLSAGTQLLLLVHAPVSQRAFYYFSQHRLGDRVFLRVDYSIEFGGTAWLEFLPVVLVLLAFFTFALPLSLGWQLWGARAHLQSPMTKEQIGFLYFRFRKGAEAWEVHEVLRRVTLTGLLIYFEPRARAAIALMVCVITCCNLNYFRPYTNRLVLLVAQFAFVMTAMKYLVTLLDDGSGDVAAGMMTRTQLGWILVAMDLAVFLGTVVAALVVLVVLKRDLSQDTASASKAVRAGHPPGSTQIVPTGGSAAGRVASGGERMSRLPAPASRQRAVHANAVDEVKLQTPPTPKPRPTPRPTPKPRLETRPKPGTETKPEAKPETKPEAKPEAKPKTAAPGETKADVTQTGVPTPPSLDDGVMLLVQVTVPPGIGPGKMFGVKLADGRTIHAKVPKHGKSGDVISVPVRSAASSHADL